MDMMERYGEDHWSTINPPVRVCASTCECFDPPPELVELCAGIVDTHIFIYSQYVINASCICQTTGSSTQSMYHTTKHKVAIFGDWFVKENRATDIQVRLCGYGHAFIFIFQKNREPN